MRRSLFTLFASAALLASAAPASAQVLGVKLGASFANLSAEDTDTDRITGFAGGGFLRFGSGRVGLQLELLSVTKGADNLLADEDDTELRIEYVEIPLLLHVPLTSGQPFAPYVFGGPAISLQSGCTLEVGSQSFDCDDDGLFRTKSTDFGVAAGAGFAFAMGPGSVLVEGRYTWGLSNINDNDSSKVRNRAAYLMAGYMIPLVRGY